MTGVTTVLLVPGVTGVPLVPGVTAVLLVPGVTGVPLGLHSASYREWVSDNKIHAWHM